MFFIAYTFKGQVHVFERCKSLILQDMCNIEIFLSPDITSYFSLVCVAEYGRSVHIHTCRLVEY